MVTFVIFFPERRRELLVLAGLESEEVPVSGMSEIVDLSQDLVREIQKRLAALPGEYLQAVPALGRSRMQELLGKRRVFVEDVAFLKKRVLNEWISCFEQESAQLNARLKDLEPKAKELPGIDMVYFKSGGKMEGVIVEEEGDSVKIKSQFGFVKRAKADILRTERIVLGPEFPDRLKAAEGKTEALVALIDWCKEKKLPVQKDYVCCLVLTRNPLNVRVRQELSLGESPLPSSEDDK